MIQNALAIVNPVVATDYKHENLKII